MRWQKPRMDMPSPPMINNDWANAQPESHEMSWKESLRIPPTNGPMAIPIDQHNSSNACVVPRRPAANIWTAVSTPETGDKQRDAAEQKMKQVRSSCAPQQSAMIFQTLADSVNQVPTNPRRNCSSAAQRNAQGQADGLRRDVVQPLGERRDVAVITAQQPVQQSTQHQIPQRGQTEQLVDICCPRIFWTRLPGSPNGRHQQDR
mmetsp:Transcript_779/g.2951  ORF Transcript_779/g.2951 Transcript_779/m.2951 type:complete len:204 (+) Transcript_779:903-1514(+)